MAAVTKSRRSAVEPDPDTIYRAVISFASSALPQVIQAGARLRGSHPAVRTHFEKFVPDGADDVEIWERRVALDADRSAALAEAQPGPAPAAPLDDEDAAICVRPVRDSSSARGANAGDRLRRDSPLVKREPGSFQFVTVGPDGQEVPRDRALVALESMSHEDVGGALTTVVKGQWVDRDHFLTTLHPRLWRLPMVRLAG